MVDGCIKESSSVNEIPYTHIDYKFLATGSEELILQHCIGKEVVILDNADLYLTPNLFTQIRETGATIILSKKSTYGLDMSDAHLYTVNYKGSSLVTRRLC